MRFLFPALALALALPVHASGPRIKSSVLSGKWTSANGDVLSFKDDKATYRPAKGAVVTGAYRLEGYRLVIGSTKVGWIGLEKPTEFRLNFTKDSFTRFTKN